MEASEFLSKQKNKILNVGIILLALFVAGRIYGKQLKEIEVLKANKELESKRSEILESISKTEKKIGAYRDLLGRKEASDVINAVSNIAKECNVKIISIRPVTPQRYAEYVKTPFNLSLTAKSYHALGNFISKVESFQDVYMIESIDIRAQSQPKELSISLTLSSIAYK